MPMTISLLDWALAGAIRPRTPTIAASAIRVVRHLRICSLPSSRTSVRERPDAEVTADVPPEAIQALWLDDQEHDDEHPEQRETEGGDQVAHRRLCEEDGAERLHGVPDE